jgi:hypothetical protein
MFQSVLRIRIGFNANPDLASYFSVDADADPGAKPMRIHADPDPGQTLRSQKLDFDILYEGNITNMS